MRQRLLLLIALFIGATSMMAAPVSLQQARQQARQFMTKRLAATGGQRHAPLQLNLTAVEQPTDTRYYVFNADGEQGFVIVSADDRTTPILGYSDSGQFDPQDIPENMQEWLDGYNNQLRWLADHPTAQQAPAQSAVKEAIMPLLTTLWNQDDPYNRLVKDYFVYGNAVTGCVATAMAQVLYYHAKLTGKPAGTTIDIPAYNTKYGYTVPEHTVTTFDWDHMLPSYSGKTGDAYETECNAVATLMAWVGASVSMDYANTYNGGSSSNLLKVASALPEYYDFEGTYISRDDYTYDSWQLLVYNELLAGRPVLYSGQSSGGGHAFVIDGYDGDGLYHVNWGWGGGSNGYFQLSILNSNDKSGIGASSSDDGYSLSQDMVIGLQPATGETPAEEGAQMTPRNIAVSGNTVTFSAWNWSGATNTFDMGVGYVDQDGTIGDVTTVFTNRTFDPTYGNGSLTVTIDAGSRPAGTYKMVVTSKTSDSETWLTKMNPEKNYIEAVFDGDGNVVLTLHPLPISLQATSFSFTGTKAINEKQSVQVAIQNNSEEFYGVLYFFASQSSTAKGDAVSYTGTTIAAGTTADVQFTFTPTATGTWYVWVATDSSGDNVIGQDAVQINSSGTSDYTDNIDLTASLTVTNADGNLLIGNTAMTHITMQNPSAQAYKGRIYLMRWLWKKVADNRYSASGGFTSKEVTIDAGGSVEFDLESLTMSDAEYYSVSVRQTKNGSRTDTDLASSDWYTLTDGYAVYAADGTKTIKRAEATIATSDDDLFVDLRGQSTVQTIATISNPNTLFAIDEGTTLAGEATNIIVGTEAERISLTDGYNLYVPFAFTASEISYTRTFSKGYKPGAYGWETIMLPFSVGSVQTVDETPIDWFHSADDTGKQFWVMEYCGDDNDQVYFTHATELKAYKPYIIAVPGAEYPKYDLTGQAITFSGADAQFYPTSDLKAQVGGNVYKFVGVQSDTNAPTDSYTLDADGHQFTKSANADASSVNAFRAYFTGRSAVSSLPIALGSQSTGINSLTATNGQTATGVYNLSGMRVADTLDHLPAGVYIVRSADGRSQGKNGKIVIK